MSFGLSALSEALKQGQQKSSTPPTGDREGGSAPRLDYLNLKSGERKILRFLTDDIWIGWVYDFILCNDGKTRNFIVDGSEDWVAKYASPTPGVGWRQRPNAPIEELQKRKQGINIAVLREEVSDGKGGIQVVDQVYDLPIGDKTYKARKFLIVRQALSNFWSHLDGCLARYGTFTDRDYQIGRTGSDKTTTYSFTPLDPIEGLRDSGAVQAEYGYGRPWPKRLAENAFPAELEAYDKRFMFCPQTIQEWVAFFGSEEWIKRYLITSETETVSPSLGGSGRYSGLDEFRAPDEAQVESTPGEEFASLRKLLSNKK